MDTFLISVYVILGIYYFCGIITYVYIYSKKHDRNLVYLNARLLSFDNQMETDLDNIIESDCSSEESGDLSYGGY